MTFEVRSHINYKRYSNTCKRYYVNENLPNILGNKSGFFLKQHCRCIKATDIFIWEQTALPGSVSSRKHFFTFFVAENSGRVPAVGEATTIGPHEQGSGARVTASVAFFYSMQICVMIGVRNSYSTGRLII